MPEAIVAKHLDGIGDLIVAAPVKRGFINAFETITYETRLKLVMEALFKIRVTAREHSLITPFPDIESRIESLLDFRLVVIDTAPQKTLLLTATFDRAWEPYMRLIWRPLGIFLDPLFCNCDGYVTASQHSFREFAGWVRQQQLESDFFYTATGLTYGDLKYLSKIERRNRESRFGDHELATTRTVVDKDDDIARTVRTTPTNALEVNEMALEALVALYRLTDFFPMVVPKPGGGYTATVDGPLLHAATREFLRGWDTSVLPAAVKTRFAVQLAWYDDEPVTPPPASGTPPRYRPRDVQGGIITTYDRPANPVSHGCLLLMRINNTTADLAKARAFIGSLVSGGPLKLSSEANPDPNGDGIHVNLAFTRYGLTRLGMLTDAFPAEFVEGVEARASLIGDVRGSHPRRWTLPRRNWGKKARVAAAPIELSEIDIIIQLRTCALNYPGFDVATEAGHPLRKRVVEIEAAAGGLTLLGIESMRRPTLDPNNSTDHFGFSDGISQPIVVPRADPDARDEVSRGEILWGYYNDRGDGPTPPNLLLDNGTFLVIRKLRLDRAGLEAIVDAGVAATPAISRDVLLGKMIGRSPDGTPLIPGAKGPNDFDYDGDPEGRACPFQSHIRRANPRISIKKSAFGRATPRIMRRGMSYGPPVTSPVGDRGIMFMAYNASLAEQFEVIQRWINGGNATGVASCQSDPLLGVARSGDQHSFRFEHGGEVVRIDVPPPVTLQWGAYAFVPSLPAVAAIAKGPGPVTHSAELDQGRRIIERLLAIETGPGKNPVDDAAAAWKDCLEDFFSKDPDRRADSPAVWAAIRADHGGVLRVPYPVAVPGEPYKHSAVLVADKTLVMEVFADANLGPDGTGRYTMKSHQARLTDSIGEIYLGLDRGKRYDDLATVPNKALFDVFEPQAFGVARAAADALLDFALAQFAAVDPLQRRSGKLDLRREYITPILAGICAYWFGIPDKVLPSPPAPPPDPTQYHPAPGKEQVEDGSWDSGDPNARLPRCPADFMAPSRFVFYPDPVPAVQAYGRDQGKQLRRHVTALFAAERAAASVPGGPKPAGKLMPNLFVQFPNNDELARTIVGIMTGFLPPTDANLRWTLYDWTEGDQPTLWRLQQALAANTDLDPYVRAKAALYEPMVASMQKRPAPDLLWRLATRDHFIGSVEVKAGDRVIIGVSSATQADLEAGVIDPYPIFGGNREPGVLHGTHACPAYKFAMGTMLGVLSALLERGRLEILPSPLILKLTDLS